MKVTLEGIKDTAAFAQAGVTLPKYDVAEVQKYSVPLLMMFLHLTIS